MAPRSTPRQGTPPNHQRNIAASDSRSSRSPAVGQQSPTTASPASIKTPTDASPAALEKHSGPALLPKIRKQDQTLEPIVVPQLPCYRPPLLSASFSHDGFLTSYHRRQTPPEGSLLTPISAVSYTSHELSDDELSSGLSANSYYHHHRPTSLPLVNTGVRSVPSDITSAPNRHLHSSTYSTALWVPSPHGLQPPTITSPHSPLAPELVFENYPEHTPATTLRTYLTAKVQPPSLVTKVPRVDPNTGPFFWDIRNLRRWESFTLRGIHQIPQLKKLLDFPLPEPSLPQPRAFHSQPDSLLDLHNLYDRVFSVKVTEALKASTGVPHLVMSSQRPVNRPGAPLRVPDFIAKYPLGMQPSELDPTTFGSYPAQPFGLPGDNSAADNHPRARVIGLVRPYTAWNSGMRSGGSTERTDYLRQLAQLHEYMRNDRCRYGYIITEIELVCVRMGTAPSNEWPIFGLLELSEPIPLAAHAPSKPESDSSRENSRSHCSNGGSGHAARESQRLSRTAPQEQPEHEGTLTVALALWYLHMLAKETPLEGQPSWKVHIGPSQELSRQRVLPRDKLFISDLRPSDKDARTARHCRGWVWPTEPLAKRHEKSRGRWTKNKEKAMQEEIERQYAAYVESLARAEAAAYYAGHNEGYTDHYQRAG